MGLGRGLEEKPEMDLEMGREMDLEMGLEEVWTDTANRCRLCRFERVERLVCGWSSRRRASLWPG